MFLDILEIKVENKTKMFKENCLKCGLRNSLEVIVLKSLVSLIRGLISLISGLISLISIVVV